MTVKTGSTWAGLFVTLDATGALAAGTPAGVLYVDGVADGASVTITGSNPYKWSVTLPALTAGQRVDMYITATISTIATASVVASEQADTALLSEVKTDTAAILADTGTDGVKIHTTQGAITWGQQKIVANVAGEGALDIENTNATGIGTMNEAPYAGMFNKATGASGSGLLNNSTNASGVGQRNYADGSMSYGIVNVGTLKNVSGFDSAQALEATLTAIKGAGWGTETLAAIDVLIDAIKAKTDQLAFTVANQVDANALTGGGGDSASVVADAVWDEAMAGHVGAGTLGKAVADILEDSGTTIPNDLVDIENKIDVIATDTTTEIPASITALDGKIDTIDNYIDTEVAAIKAKTDNLPASPANEATLTAMKGAGWTNENLTTIDANVDAIKLKTDNLPSDPADQSAVEAAITAGIGTIPAGITAEDVMTAIVEGAITLRDSLKLANAMNAGKLSGGNTNTIKLRDLADTLDRIIMTVDVDGNRSNVAKDYS